MELWDANSFYNAMKIGLNRRFSSGFQLQLSYNNSKFIDDSSNVGHYDDQGSSPDPDDHKSGRGFSGLHVRHTFTTNFTYDLPLSQQGLIGHVLGGWQINGIFTAADGPTDTIDIALDNARSGQQELSQRPELLQGASNNPVLSDGRDPNRYFDVNVFELAEEGYFGNLARNTLIEPGLITFDFSLVKNFSLYEEAELQFKAEFFNLLNRANFGGVGTRVFTTSGRSSTAGTITNTSTTSRQIQFALKILF